MTTKKTTTTDVPGTVAETAEPTPENALNILGVVNDFEAEYIHPLVLIQEALSAPFPQEFVSYRDGPYNKELKRKEQLRYVNINRYEDRLNAVAFGYWSSSEPKVQNVQQWKTPRHQDQNTKQWVEGEPFIDHGYVVTTTVTIHGVTHGGTSDFEDTVTAGYAAAFKRACLKFGLGRELYEKEEGTTNPQTSGSTRSTSPQATTSQAGGTKSSDGGYPRPTEGQRGFLMKLGVPQSLIEQHDGNGNYTITGNIGRLLIDTLKDGGMTVSDALAEHGIQMPASTRSSDGLPVRSGYTRR